MESQNLTTANNGLCGTHKKTKSPLMGHVMAAANSHCTRKVPDGARAGRGSYIKIYLFFYLYKKKIAAREMTGMVLDHLHQEKQTRDGSINFM